MLYFSTGWAYYSAYALIRVFYHVSFNPATGENESGWQRINDVQQEFLKKGYTCYATAEMMGILTLHHSNTASLPGLHSPTSLYLGRTNLSI
jgi:hypothetical protein